MSRPGNRTEADRQYLPWSEEEHDLLCAYYPDYQALRRHLPHRTLPALKRRVQIIGIAKRRHVWTNHEVVRLRKAYEEGASDHELAVLFPELRMSQVKGKASNMGIVRCKQTPVRFDVPALDAIRARSAKKGLSFVELDRNARTGRFFQKSCRRASLKHIVRAATFLGAEVSIEWDE
jgi:hypothetical protein